MNREILEEMSTAINQRNVEAIRLILSADTKFVDPYGNAVTGIAATLEAWQNCFQLYPSFAIDLEETVESGQMIVFFGRAGNEEPPHSWSSPICVKASLDSGKICSWQVFGQLSEPSKMATPAAPTNKKVTSIGGVFFKCVDPEALKKWYQQHLGFVVDQYGTSFEWIQADRPAFKGYTAWSPMSESTTYFDPSDKQFMINYRVQNLEKLVAELQASGVIICDAIESYEYGKFVHILDIENNKIELWEPVDEVYEAMLEVRMS